MKVIFLDFDGVINTRGWDRAALDNVSNLVKLTGARIVVTSQWRHSHDLGDLRQLLNGLGVAGACHAEQTPILPEDPESLFPNRHEEIEAWLKEHPEVTEYVVLDDLDYLDWATKLGPHVVVCKYDVGFDDRALKKAYSIFNMEVPADEG